MVSDDAIADILDVHPRWPTPPSSSSAPRTGAAARTT
jgi:hypothetical protein